MGQKGVGLSGKVVTDPGSFPIAGKKVFIVFDASAAPYVTNLNRELVTQPDGSYSIYEPNIPDTIIPLNVMVYTFDCEYHRKGFLVTYNENDVFAGDVNISICNSTTPPLQSPIIASATDNNCPTYTLLQANDSLNKKYLTENYQWKLNGAVISTESEFPILLNEENNNLMLFMTVFLLPKISPSPKPCFIFLEVMSCSIIIQPLPVLPFCWPMQEIIISRPTQWITSSTGIFTSITSLNAAIR
jgi:hypothetical protein